MISRFQPSLGLGEIFAALRPGGDSVSQFESAFAAKFGCAEGIAFNYGRTALCAFLEAVGLKNRQVVVPAYTCSVVAHAVVLSGNVPHFIDCDLNDYNADLSQLEAAINEQTGAVVATHLFGYALDQDRLREIIERAERRLNRKIWVIQDCAHSFGATWKGRMVTMDGDAALFGLNISKTLTTVFGGMLLTNSAEIAAKLRSWRATRTQPAPTTATGYKFAYLLGASIAFRSPWFRLLYWLQHRTNLLKGLTDAYHLDEQVAFPPDAHQRMAALQARIGLVQLERYDRLIAQRARQAHRWDARLAREEPGWIRPPLRDGSTYSHYVVRVPDRRLAVEKWARQGYELGELIQYSVAALPAYRNCPGSNHCPNALHASQFTVNFPVTGAIPYI